MGVCRNATPRVTTLQYQRAVYPAASASRQVHGTAVRAADTGEQDAAARMEHEWLNGGSDKEETSRLQHGCIAMNRASFPAVASVAARYASARDVSSLHASACYRVGAGIHPACIPNSPIRKIEFPQDEVKFTLQRASQVIRWSEKEQRGHPLKVHVCLAVNKKIQVGQKFNE